ncbi:MAG: glycosyltransferase family 2 protein [Prevotella sp.]|jgi:glycosyltransferase involved in cell wall biosynthesis|nr:glycosyltransferase family 2 protein [Prevotella sp.]
MPYISVIVPCYNQAQYLNEALQSVLDQSYTDWECIIVNDGSPDNTREIAEKWNIKDSRFRYLEKENGGISSARNAGIEIANGKWILPLDADDLIGKEYMVLAMKAIDENPNIGVLYANATLFGEKSGPFELFEYDFRRLLRLNMIYITAFFKKEDWVKVGGFDTNLIHGLEDWEFWINLIGNTKKEVLKIDYQGFYYRIKNVSRNQSIAKEEDKKRDINIYVLKKHIDLYIDTFGTYQNLLDMNDQLIYNNNVLMERIDKRERFLVMKIFRKLQSIYNKIFH